MDLFIVNLKWRFSKKLLWILFAIAVLIPAVGAFWILVQFDIPFIHGGDRFIGRVILFLWWLSCTILIFGWRIENEK